MQLVSWAAQGTCGSLWVLNLDVEHKPHTRWGPPAICLLLIWKFTTLLEGQVQTTVLSLVALSRSKEHEKKTNKQAKQSVKGNESFKWN